MTAVVEDGEGQVVDATSPRALHVLETPVAQGGQGALDLFGVPFLAPMGVAPDEDPVAVLADPEETSGRHAAAMRMLASSPICHVAAGG